MKVFLISLVLVLCFVFLAEVIFNQTLSDQKISYGVSFSPNYARYLGLDWQKTFISILDDLAVRNFRISSFWDAIEKDPMQQDFSQVDFQLSEARKRGAKILLVLGARQPRWPECHIPVWAKSLTVEQRQVKILEFVQRTVERYKDHPEIRGWQVENEPFAFWFGEKCDLPDENFLKKEVNLVRKIDPNRQVLITDSGEWGNWISSLKFSDVLGISIYKRSYNSTWGIYTVYPFPAWVYSLKSAVLRKLFAPQNEKTIVAELQVEPWLSDEDSKKALPEKETELFSLENFKDNINFAKKTGFNEQYLWGVEWWFFMAQNGYPEYLEYAKTLFK